MAARHKSRRRALQVLFEWDMRGESIDHAIQHYYDTLHSDDEQTDKPLKADKFMEQLARGQLPMLPRSIKRLSPSRSTGDSTAWP